MGRRLEQLVYPRVEPQFDSTVGQDCLTAFARSGVLRDSRGLPIFDSAPEMAPIYARGLDTDFGVYHEMSRGDSVIGGTLGELRTTIARGTYVVQAEPDETPEERDARDLLCAFTGLSTDLGVRPHRWSGALEGGLPLHFEQACDRQVYGFSAFEVIPSVHRWRGRLVRVPSRLKWIPPWSVARWLWQGDRLVGLTQVTQISADYTGSYGESQMLSFVGGAWGGWRYVDIPITNLLIYINRYVDGNPEGTSDIRPLWLPWAAKKMAITGYEAAKEALYGGYAQITQKVDAATGQPLDTMAETNQSLLEANADKLIDGKVKRITVPPGWDLSVLHPEYEIPDPVNVLSYYDQRMREGMRAILLGLPDSHAGSASMSDAAEELMQSATERNASDVIDVFDGLPGMPWTGVVERLLSWNYPEGTLRRYPRVSVMGFSNMKALAEVMRSLEQFRLLTPTSADEQMLRHRARLHVPTLVQLDKARAANYGPTQATQTGTQATQKGTQ